MKRLLVFALALILGCATRGTPEAATGASAPSDHRHACTLDVGQKIEPVTGPAFPGGEPVTFPRGDVTLVAFLEMSNRYLEHTVPHLVDLDARYRSRGLKVLLVDGEHDMSREMANHWQAHPAPFPIVWDKDRAIHAKLRSSGATVALFDRSGVVRYVHPGNPDTEDIDAAALERETKTLLDHPRSTIASYPPPPCETQAGQRLARAEFPRLDVPGGKIAIPSGPWTLVAFVATWSGPDKQAMPKLARVAETYRARGLTVVLVFVDDEPAGIVDFVRESGAHGLPTVHDAGHRITNELQPATCPTFLLLDAQGAVRHIINGYHQGEFGQPFDEVATKLMVR